MKKYTFFCSKEIPSVSPCEEIIEFEDDVTDEEVAQEFREWVFGQLDTAYWETEEAR